MNRAWKIALSALITVVVLTTTALGAAQLQQMPQQKKKPAEVGDTAKKVLKDVANYFKGLDSARMEVLTSVQMERQGQKQNMELSQDITMERPNKLVIKVQQGDAGNSLTSDGEKLYAYVSRLGVYKVSEAPKNFQDFAKQSDVVTGQLTALGGTAGSPPVPALFSQSPYEAMIKDASQVKHVGVEKIDGKKYDRVRFVQQRMDWDLWVAQGDQPAIHKIVPDISKALKAMQQQAGGQAPQDMKLDIKVQIAKWMPNPDLGKDAFSFSPPEGASEVSSWMEAVQQQRQSKSKLVGQAAPDFTLKQLDGDKEVSLSDHEGSEAVVLDFWATWCSPCRKALPKLEELTKKYDGKGVAIYAVNQGESADKARSFLQDQKLDLNVLLDPKGSTGQKYGVRGIPTTVIIDQNGTVKAVHTGYDPNMKETVSKELDALK